MKKKVVLPFLLSAAIIGSAGCSMMPAQESQQPSQPPSIVEESSTMQALYVTPDTCTIQVGERRSFTVQSDKGTENTIDFLWTCDDNSIADVDFSGNVIGKSEGNCVITIASKNQAGLMTKVSVKVKAAEESSQQASKTESSTAPAPEPSSQVSVQTKRKNLYSYSNYEDAGEAYRLVGNYLSASDIEGLTEHDAQLLINTIYAKHGYQFSDNEVRRFFESQYWYNSIYNKTKNMNSISEIINGIDMDRTNLQLLQSIA